MPEWLIERGIGEARFALVDEGRIVEARIELDGTIVAGSIIAARLTNIGSDGRNAIAGDASGTEYLLPRGAPGRAEGGALNIEIIRSALPGPEPWKRPLSKVTAWPSR